MDIIVIIIVIIIIITINFVSMRDIEQAPQMTLQTGYSVSPFSPLCYGTYQTLQAYPSPGVVFAPFPLSALPSKAVYPHMCLHLCQWARGLIQ